MRAGRVDRIPRCMNLAPRHLRMLKRAMAEALEKRRRARGAPSCVRDCLDTADAVATVFCEELGARRRDVLNAVVMGAFGPACEIGTYSAARALAFILMNKSAIGESEDAIDEIVQTVEEEDGSVASDSAYQRKEEDFENGDSEDELAADVLRARNLLHTPAGRLLRLTRSEPYLLSAEEDENAFADVCMTYSALFVELAESPAISILACALFVCNFSLSKREYSAAAAAACSRIRRAESNAHPVCSYLFLAPPDRTFLAFWSAIDPRINTAPELIGDHAPFVVARDSFYALCELVAPNRKPVARPRSAVDDSSMLGWTHAAVCIVRAMSSIRDFVQTRDFMVATPMT